MRRAQATSLIIAAAILPWTAQADAPITDYAPEQFMGWEPKGSSWNAITCDPKRTYTTSDGFVRCCENVSQDCAYVTRCSSNVMYFENGTQNCNKGQTCVTMTIYESSTAAGPYVRNMFCWDNWSAFTIFQQTPITSTSAPTSTTTTASAGITYTAPTATSTSQQSNDDDPPKDPEDQSKAWIAGAVVGPVAACALIGALGFWIGRRRRQRASGQSMIPISEVDGAENGVGYFPYGDDSKQRSRHSPLPSELGDRRAHPPVVEMDSHEVQRPHYREVPGSSPDEL